MKLSWRDLVTTGLAIFGGTVVYAKFYDYSWAVVSSWRSAVAVLALTGLAMFAFSRFNFSNRSILNEVEMVLGVIAIGLAITGMVFVSQPIFYILAAALGILWLIDTARHVRHSLVHEDTTSSYHHHASAH